MKIPSQDSTMYVVVWSEAANLPACQLATF